MGKLGLMRRTNKLNSKEVEKRFNELVSSDKFICSKQELDLFELHGLLLRSGKKFIDRAGKFISVNIIKQREFSFTDDFSELIGVCNTINKNEGITKIYCMSKQRLDEYSSNSLIVEKDGKQYYRKFQNEYWLIYLI